MTEVIVGYGEIGRAVALLKGDCYIVDFNLPAVNIPSNIDVMHICFPYSEGFVAEVARYTKQFNPEHTIVWSTVPIGTTKKIPRAVHSPVEGRHPKLEASIKLMPRWVSYNDANEGLFFPTYFADLGLNVRLIENTDCTEALKLLSTTEYGVNLVFADYKARVAREIDMDYELTKEWNQDYNQLYKDIGMSDRFQKFVLDAPEGHIGGHCIIENAVLLDEQYSHFLTRRLLANGKSIQDEKPYLNRTWLYAEYWGKGRSSEEIGAEFGCSGSNILQIMKRLNINRRTQCWTQSETNTLIKLSLTHTFKEIAPEVGKTYDAVRLKAIKLAIKSMYNPSERDETTRKKISASLQGITLEEWTEFTSTADMIIRRSDEYKEWRRAVFKRDNYICIQCGSKRLIEADHIKSFANYPELRFDINNGRTLCNPCHKKTDTYGGKTRRIK